MSEQTQQLLPLIEHKIKSIAINQRANDGYINATAVCKASDKRLNDYIRLKTTSEYLNALSSSTGIPTSELVQVRQGGIPQEQGTWVHPQVAINLGTWVSPEFAVFVSKWAFEWMAGANKSSYQMPYHLRRYLVNRHKIPPTHFSIIDQLSIKLLASLEEHGYIPPDNVMPDIALGTIFNEWLRENGYHPEEFPVYVHDFDNGKRPPVTARLFPNELLTDFNLQINEWIRSGKALQYFKERDADSIEALTSVWKALPQ